MTKSKKKFNTKAALISAGLGVIFTAASTCAISTLQSPHPTFIPDYREKPFLSSDKDGMAIWPQQLADNETLYYLMDNDYVIFNSKTQAIGVVISDSEITNKRGTRKALEGVTYTLTQIGVGFPFLCAKKTTLIQEGPAIKTPDIDRSMNEIAWYFIGQSSNKSPKTIFNDGLEIGSFKFGHKRYIPTDWDTLPFLANSVIYGLGIFIAGTMSVSAYKFALAEIRKDNGQCGQCGYDLSGSASGPCPECGTAMDLEGDDIDHEINNPDAPEGDHLRHARAINFQSY